MKFRPNPIEEARLAKTREQSLQIAQLVVVWIADVLLVLSTLSAALLGNNIYTNTTNLAGLPKGSVEVVQSYKGENPVTASGSHVIKSTIPVESWVFGKPSVWWNDSMTKQMDKLKNEQVYYSPDSIVLYKAGWDDIKPNATALALVALWVVYLAYSIWKKQLKRLRVLVPVILGGILSVVFIITFVTPIL